MYKYVAVDVYATLFMYWLDVILLTAVSGGGINDHALLGESGRLLLAIGHKF